MSSLHKPMMIKLLCLREYETKAEKNEAKIASECKEILTTQTMRSKSPKPTCRRKEKEEKDTADVTSNKKADDRAFASFSSLEEEEEEVRHFAARF